MVNNFNRAFTSSFYGYETKLTFGFENINRYLFIASLILSYIFLPHVAASYVIVSILIALKLIFQILFWASVCKSFNYKKIMFEVPLYELITPVINLLFIIYSRSQKKKHYTLNLNK